jgi:glycosyltransferase involved in cell wall biosynthesis
MRRKILHVIGGMNRGGVETWLMHVMRNIDRDAFETHFLVHSTIEGAYDKEIASLGGQIHYGATPRNLLRYATDFSQLVRRYGPFDVVHSHVYWYSGFVMRLAYEAGIPIRIAHSHTATSDSAWKVPRRLYQRLMRRWILRYSTHRIGISQPAGEALFGQAAEKPFTLLYYGLDFSRFAGAPSPEEAKRKLGIAPERKVIGHVGRFVPVKNHSFTLQIFAQTLAQGTDAHLLLVGDGPLLPSVKAQIDSSGLAKRCTFTGSQPDVVPFLSAMNVFVLPSQWEGLGLAALESQAAGVPVIASTSVPREVDVIPELIEHIPLESSGVVWTSAVNRRLNEAKHRSGDEAQVLERSRFGLPRCLKSLSGIYLGHAN